MNKVTMPASPKFADVRRYVLQCARLRVRPNVGQTELLRLATAARSKIYQYKPYHLAYPLNRYTVTGDRK